MIPVRALVVEDSEDDAVLLTRELLRGEVDFAYLRVETAVDMRAALESSTWDIVISDYSLPDFSAPAALRVLKDTELDLPFIVVSGTVGEDVAVKTMKEGASDYLLKGNLTRLVSVVLREVEQARSRRADRQAAAQAAEALQASELRYRRLFESATDGVLILDADTGEIVDVNPFLLELIGSSYERMVGRHLWEIGVFKDVVASKESFRVLQEKDYVRYEHLPLQARDGRAVDVEFVSNAYFVDRKKVIQCDVRDITARRQADRALRSSEARFRELVEQLPEMVFETDLTGRISFVNALASTTLGLSPEDLGRGLRIVDLVAPEFRALTEADIQLLHGEASVGPREIAFKRKDGTLVPVSIHSVLFHHEGAIAGIRGVAVDITERKRAEALVRKTSAYARSLLEASLDPLVTISPEGKITDVNEAAIRVRGVSREALVGTRFSDYFTEPDKAEAGYKLVLSEGEVRDYPLTLRHVSGQTIDVLYNATVYRDESGTVQGVFAAARDITERKRAEQELAHANATLAAKVEEIEVLNEKLREKAVRDPLTGLYNRRYLEETIERDMAYAIRKGLPLAVATLDIDRFKEVNDAHGHATGDQVLMWMADVLRENVRASDLVTRSGGEEFVVVMPGATLEAALARAERWRERFAREPLPVHDGIAVACSVSIGVALHRGRNETFDVCLGRADAALYAAKRAGRNLVVSAEAGLP